MDEIKKEITELLDSGSESQNYDLKKGIIWKDKTEHTLSLVADIMAFANTQDGGTIILGLDDKTLDFSAVPGDWWNSYDATKVMNAVNKYCDPRINVRITKILDFEYKNKKGPLVILKISEFSDSPIICKSNGNTSENKPIFYAGQIYIRTNRVSTEAVSNAQDMRDLIVRGMLKKRDELLQSFEAIISGKKTPLPVQLFAEYNEEIKNAMESLG
jgi:predicted HTH transcriptional regulator